MSFNNVQFFGAIKLDNIHAQNTELSYADLLTQDFRYLVTGSYSTPTVFKTETTQHISSIAIDNTRVLVCYYIATGAAGIKFRIYDDTGTALSSETSVSGYDQDKIAIVKVSTDKFVICYGYGSNEGRAAVLTTTGNVVTVYSSTTFINYDIDSIAVDLIDSSQVLAIYNDADNNTSKAQILAVSGTSISENSANEVEYNDSNETLYNKVHVLSSTKCVVFFQDQSDFSGKGQIFTLSGNEITNLSSLFEFDTYATYIESIKIDSLKIILSYFTTTGQCRIVTVGETSIVYRESKEFSSNSVTYISMTEISNNDLYLITYVDHVTNKYGRATIVSILNDYYVQLEESENFSTDHTIYMSSVYANNKVLIFYQNIDNSNYGELCIGSSFATSTTKIDFEQVWNNVTTVFLANFENSLEAGNISSSITGWRLKRKASDGNLFITLEDDIAVSVRIHIDYLPRNNISYTYSIYSLSASGESLGIEKVDSVDFDGWILTDNVNTYKFDLGWNSIQTSDINVNKNKHVYENYTQYPVVSFGQQKYKNGSIKAMPYQWNSTDIDYTINETVRSEIETFINNNEEKWLKSPAGEILKVVTFGFSYKYEDKIQSQPHEISFDWIEVAIGEEGL